MRLSPGFVVAAVIACAPSAPTNGSKTEVVPMAPREPADAAVTPTPAPAAIPIPPVLVPPDLVPGPAEGAIAPLVAEARAQAQSEGRTLVVVVGASWCDPCVRFHDALLRGELDAALPGIRFLEFDLDRDGARLREAGYTSRYVPLFVIPGEDGVAGARRIEGGIKGDLAVDHIVRRLGPLITGAG